MDDSRVGFSTEDREEAFGLCASLGAGFLYAARAMADSEGSTTPVTRRTGGAERSASPSRLPSDGGLMTMGAIEVAVVVVGVAILLRRTRAGAKEVDGAAASSAVVGKWLAAQSISSLGRGGSEGRLIACMEEDEGF